MRKRANGEGTIGKRTVNGQVVGWRGAITVGRDAQGQQVRRWVSGKTQTEVRHAVRRLQAELNQGVDLIKEGVTVGDFLAHWIAKKARDGIMPNTLRSYRDTIRLHINPLLGEKSLQKLKSTDVEHMLTQLHQAGKSRAALAYSLKVLRMALHYAVLHNNVARDVTAGIKTPTRDKPEIQVWTPAQVVQFLRVSETHRLHAAYYLALMTGMRRGEILGLRWMDIDWEKRRLHVRHSLVEVRGEGQPGKLHRGKPTVSSKTTILQSPKTATSRRIVALSQGTLDKLQEHQRRQKAERFLIGLNWSEQDYVFANEVGKATEPRTLYGWYRQLIEQAEVPRIRFHDLRHTAASLMIRKGLPPKVVADRLGHRDVAFTLSVYTHIYDEQRQEAAMDLADLFPLLGKAPQGNLDSS